MRARKAGRRWSQSGPRNAALAIKDACGSIAMAPFLRRLIDHYDGALGTDRSGGLAPLEYDPDSQREGAGNGGGLNCYSEGG